MLTDTDICDLIPHSDNMCLLDKILSWDSNNIACNAKSHLRLDNPLIHEGCIHSVCGIEYASQAAAAHCALLIKNNLSSAQRVEARSDRVIQGYLVSVPKLSIHQEYLSDIKTQITVNASRTAESGKVFSYEFSLDTNTSKIVSGTFLIKQQED